MDQTRLYKLLARCTVRLKSPDDAGTGFFVAPGLVLTCSHVVKSAWPDKAVDVFWEGRKIEGPVAIVPEHFQPENSDLALLRVELADHPCVLLDEAYTLRDEMLAFGYPGGSTTGDPVTLVSEDWPRDRGASPDLPHLKLKQGQVQPGFSGAPLLNLRTGGVCGVVDKTRDRASDLGGRALPTALVLEQYDFLIGLQNAFHSRDRTWISLLPKDLHGKAATNKASGTTEVFFSYAHKDKRLRDQLETHLSSLKRQNIITGWHDRKIAAGTEWKDRIDEHLESARIILLLVSADFLASEYCYNVELKRALERHEAGEARVIPVILRPCDWQTAPFGKLQALPTDAKPVTEWSSRDRAFQIVAEGIRKVVKEVENPLKDFTALTGGAEEGPERGPVHSGATRGARGTVPPKSAPPGLTRVETRDGTASPVVARTQDVDIELTINTNIGSFTPKQRKRLLDGIGKLLEIDRPILVVCIRPGSVKVTLRLRPAEAERLLRAFERGELADFGVVAASISSGARGQDLERKSSDSMRGTFLSRGTSTVTTALGQGGMKVFVKSGSKAERVCHWRAARGAPELKWMVQPAAITRGFTPDPGLDLHDQGGKIIPDLVFTNFYVGGQAAWDLADIRNIDTNLAKAMSDWHLNNVIVQYFRGGPITSTFRPSQILPDPAPDTISQTDVEALVTQLHGAGALAGFDFGSTVFNFMLPRGVVLTIGDGDTTGGKGEQTASSLEGLGGFHGSVGVGGDVVYYAVGAYSEGQNGIDGFGVPWKNIVATFYHELNEVRTNADGEDGAAWVTDEWPGEEIGDTPMRLAGDRLDLVMVEVPLADGSGPVPIQLMWSNAIHGPEGPVDAPRPPSQ
jgi:hypothetical protein